jgi:hypothetical protein
LKRLIPALIAVALAAACGGEDDVETPEEAVASDLQEFAGAFNDGNADEIYREHMALACRDELSEEDAEQRFEHFGEGANLAVEEPSTVEVSEDRASVRVTMKATQGGEEAAATDTLTLVLEEGRWRFSDCFGALGG